MLKKTFNILMIFMITMFLIACDPPKQIEEEEDIVKKSYDITTYVTTADKTKLLDKQADGQTVIDLNPSGVRILIDPTIKHQIMDGFGAAMTESSAYVLSQLDTAKRTEVMQSLFGLEGIGISFLRLTVGASDFSLDNYTYNDTVNNEPDLTLSGFSISREEIYLVPRLLEAQALNENLRFMASPWSAPAWMKDNKNLNGGSLRDTYIDVYADYFVRYIEAMQALGVDIYAVTPQNEPLHVTSGYPTMYMTIAQQIELIYAMGQKFDVADIETLIMAYDHNWDRMDYPISVLNSKAGQYTAGVALHGYGGNVSETARIRNIFPDKGIWFTEISGGLWATNFADNITWNMENIFMGSINLGAKAVLMWNLALDESNGPKNGGCTNCRGVVTINSETGAVTKNEEYYMIGHFSKFVQVGASRIESTVNNGNILQSAFMNPDGSIVVVVHNKSKIPASFSLDITGSQMQYSLPGQGTASFIMNLK